MNLEALLVVGGLALVVGAALLAIGLYAARLIVRRRPLHGRMRVTRLGICFAVTQTILTFAIVGWGSVRPDSLLGRIVASQVGVFAIIMGASIVGCVITVVLQGRGVVLYYRENAMGAEGEP